MADRDEGTADALNALRSAIHDVRVASQHVSTQLGALLDGDADDDVAGAPIHDGQRASDAVEDLAVKLVPILSGVGAFGSQSDDPAPKRSRRRFRRTPPESQISDLDRLHIASALVENLATHRGAVLLDVEQLEDKLAALNDRYGSILRDLDAARARHADLGLRRLDLDQTDEYAELEAIDATIANLQQSEMTLVKRREHLDARLGPHEAYLQRLVRHVAALQVLINKLRVDIERGTLGLDAPGDEERPAAGYLAATIDLKADGLLSFDDVERRRQLADSAYAARFGGPLPAGEPVDG
ncbi:hypothetical protein [Pararhizobium haloflavum]|uniref:hypothetical protein n=1 Tax=Pararhizobium haloflavum TaxID=2037914 RepID=UPI000C19B4D6|nr:hypothetical protein [Pararhizobium haloflavum]